MNLEVLKDIKPSSQVGYRAGEVKVFDTRADLINAGYSKLTLKEVTLLSTRALASSQGPELAEAISKGLKTLATAKADRQNTLSKKVSRIFLNILKYVCFATIFGIPVGLALHAHLENPRNIIGLAQDVAFFSEFQFFLGKKEGKATLSQNDKDYLRAVEKIIKEEKRNQKPTIFPYFQRSILEDIAGAVVDETVNEKKVPMLQQFKVDQNRYGSTLFIIDKRENSPYLKKAKDCDGSETYYQQPLQIMDECLSYRPADEKWVKPIQALLLQSLSNCALITLRGNCTTAGTLAEFMNNNEFYKFETEASVCKIETVRNQQTGDIEKLFVRLLIGSNLSHQTVRPEGKDTIGKVCTLLTLEVTLDAQNKPVIANPTLRHELYIPNIKI